MATEARVYEARTLPWEQGRHAVAFVCRGRAGDLKRHAAMRLARGEPKVAGDYAAEGAFWLRAAVFVEASGPLRFQEMARIAREGI